MSEIPLSNNDRAKLAEWQTNLEGFFVTQELFKSLVKEAVKRRKGKIIGYVHFKITEILNKGLEGISDPIIQELENIKRMEQAPAKRMTPEFIAAFQEAAKKKPTDTEMLDIHAIAEFTREKIGKRLNAVRKLLGEPEDDETSFELSAEIEPPKTSDSDDLFDELIRDATDQNGEDTTVGQPLDFPEEKKGN